MSTHYLAILVPKEAGGGRAVPRSARLRDVWGERACSNRGLVARLRRPRR
jgi:hypothetical protein